MIYNAIEHKDGYEIFFTENNTMKSFKSNFNPCLYVKSNQKTDYKNMNGDYVKRLNFENKDEYSRYLRDLKKNEKSEYWGDINPLYQTIIDKFWKKEIDVDKKVHIWFYDIENPTPDGKFPYPSQAKYPVVSITFYDYLNDKYYVFGFDEYSITKENTVFVKVATEKELLSRFVKFISLKKIQILVGTNNLAFDNMYLRNRMEKLNIEPNFVKGCEVRQSERDEICNFPNLQNIDYMVIYKKFSFKNLQSFSLESMCQEEMGVGKNKYDGSLYKLLKTDYQKFIDYNIRDVELLKMLEDKCGYVKLMITMASKFMCLPVDALKVTRYWDSYVYAMSLEEKVIVEKSSNRHQEDYIGGYVKEPIRGINGICALFDVESEYPTMNRRYNISTETRVPINKLEKDFHDVVVNFLYSVYKNVYDKYDNVFSSKSGADKLINSDLISDSLSEVLYIQDSVINSQKINYPTMLVIKTLNLKDSQFNLKKIKKDTYLYYCESLQDYNKLKTIYNEGEDKFKFVSGKRFKVKLKEYIRIVRRTYSCEFLIEYFAKDLKNFDRFTPFLQKYDLTMTPNLQFFKRGKYGLLPRAQEIVFNERIIFKRLETYNKKAVILAEEFSKTMSINKEKFAEIGTDISDDIKKELNTAFKTKDKTVLNDLIIKKKQDKSDTHTFNTAFKIAINGFYGATANENFRHFGVCLCESTTSGGQLTLRGSMTYIVNKLGCKWVYSDTDSGLLVPPEEIFNGLDKDDNYEYNCYLKFKQYITDFIQPTLNEYFELLKVATNSRDVKIKMDLEVICKRVLFTDKKKYAWDLWEADGTVYRDKPKYKFRGLSFVKGDTPIWVAKKQEEFVKLLLQGNQRDFMKKFVDTCRKEFKKQDIKNISRSNNISNMSKYNEDSPSLPVHYRASFNLNKLVEQSGLGKKIEDGNKIRWFYVKNDDVIGITDDVPIELLSKIEIDYDKQFEATFMGLITRIFEVMKWSLEDKKASIWD